MRKIISWGTTTIVLIWTVSLAQAVCRPYNFGGLELQETQLELSYQDYDRLLKSFVDNRGRVSYQNLKENRSSLDRFGDALNKLNPLAQKRWTRKEKLAFWINAYNALTLKAIVDNYPIQASFLSSLRYPQNSIRQISGVWNKFLNPVMGQNLTLDQIEHDILRKEFNEPLVHMALVCAAIGCPPLRNEAYRSGILEAQLKDQSRRFLANPQKFRIDRKKRRVYLSPILKWFGNDFISRYGTDLQYREHNQRIRAVLNFATQYVPMKDRIYLLKETYSVHYLHYDWSLNER